MGDNPEGPLLTQGLPRLDICDSMERQYDLQTEGQQRTDIVAQGLGRCSNLKEDVARVSIKQIMGSGRGSRTVGQSRGRSHELCVRICRRM